MSNCLANAYPNIGRRLPRSAIGTFPTPVAETALQIAENKIAIGLKRDDLAGEPYGGNKVRKLEYLIARAQQRGAHRIATFGAVGSNHAVATALYSRQAGLECTCFLSHQVLKPGLGRALRVHQQNRTEIVRFGGERRRRIATLRKYLHGRNVWVVPLGGSSWLGTLGFVDAAFELLAQIAAGDIGKPARVYVPMGTMGTAVGLALGFALAGSDIEVQAIRVTDERLTNAVAANALLLKTANLLHALDTNVPLQRTANARLTVRNEFFGAGYGCTTPATDAAIEQARNELGLTLESTYSGKALAALIHDLTIGFDEPVLFWNTYNSHPLPIDDSLPPDFELIPRDFERYFAAD